jgi:hypothetical protein
VELCSDDRLWQKLSTGAVAHAAKFSWDATAVGLMQLLAEAAQTTGRRGRTGRWR